MMNGLHFLILAVVIVGAVYVVPRLRRIDEVFMADLDDEELTAVLSEFPGVLVKVSRW